jgi:glucose-6-phosphate isomerase
MSAKDKIIKSLFEEAQRLSKKNITSLIKEDNLRSEVFSVKFKEDIYYDFSRQLISKQALDGLIDLLNINKYQQRVDKLFSGAHVNYSEDRPALHSLLREQDAFDSSHPLYLLQTKVNNELQKINNFSESVRSGQFIGVTGKIIKHLLVIGIGGSSLGIKFIYESLRATNTEIRITFLTVPNRRSIEEAILNHCLEETLVIMISKSFKTTETLLIGRYLQGIYEEELGSKSVFHHFLGISANKNGLDEFGICPDHQFYLWDWVGGRYSIWSAVGLPIAIVFGFNAFQQMLKGGYDMDQHFKLAEPKKNLPLLLGLIGIWNAGFLNKPSKSILTYDYELRYLVNYCQQLVMESNGKLVEKDAGIKQVAPIIWGGNGIEGQHSFFQAIHQGQIDSDYEFIVCLENKEETFDVFKSANCYAQIQVLLDGNTNRVQDFIEGNKASSILTLKNISPYALGLLLACYEHSVFIQSVVANINPFDQPGVEEGKKIAEASIKSRASQHS